MKNESVLIIAEAGVNHNGDESCAMALVDAAAAAGADAVKFQVFKAERLVTRSADQAAYQAKNGNRVETQFAMLKRLELSEATFALLQARCRERNVRFLATPFDLESLGFLDKLGTEMIKLGSGEVTNLPLLRAAGRLGKPIILSTGMADLAEVQSAMEVLSTAGCTPDRITLLHCTTEYPAPAGDVNLLAMCTMAQTFGVRVGYSDHTVGPEATLAAVALGACVIEKHFTLDCNQPGPDHRTSIKPDEMAALVQSIRRIKIMLGDGVKQPTLSDLRNRDVVRRSIVAARRIVAGERFTEQNLMAKRPGNGISPMRWDDLLGRLADRDYDEEEKIHS